MCIRDRHEGGFLPFDAFVTDIVRYNQYNKLSVLLNNELNEYMPVSYTHLLSSKKPTKGSVTPSQMRIIMVREEASIMPTPTQPSKMCIRDRHRGRQHRL